MTAPRRAGPRVWTSAAGGVWRKRHRGPFPPRTDSWRDTTRAMSMENVEVLRSIYDEWKQGRLGAGREMFDPEITVEVWMPDASKTVTLQGLAQWEEFMRD